MDQDDDSEEYREDWDNCLNYRDTISEILPGKLYLSDYVAAGNINNLKERQITRVISLGGMNDHVDYTVHDDVEYLFVYIDDGDEEPIHQHFDECNKFIEDGSSSVLVHCRAGISRSATIVMAYLIHTHCMTCQEAYTYVKQRRACVNPNDGFYSQLFLLNDK